MATWLLTTDPVKQGRRRLWGRGDIGAYLDSIKSWSNWSVKSSGIMPGDRFYLMLLGHGELNGIIATGEFLSEPYRSEQWSRIMGFCDFADVVFDEEDHYIPQRILVEQMPDQCWTPPSSGVMIWTKYEAELDSLYKSS